MRSPFGWRREENGVQAIYLPTWFRYRALSWNPAAKRFARARLQNFDVVHIFGLYDFLGPAIAAAMPAAANSLRGRTDRDVPADCPKSLAEAHVSFDFRQKMLPRRAFSGGHLEAGSATNWPRRAFHAKGFFCAATAWRLPAMLPERGKFRAARASRRTPS